MEKRRPEFITPADDDEGEGSGAHTHNFYELDWPFSSLSLPAKQDDDDEKKGIPAGPNGCAVCELSLSFAREKKKAFAF